MHKLVDLGGTAGTEMKTEEEPEGETIVGSVGEALRPPGMNIISVSNKFSLWMNLDSSHLVVVFYTRIHVVVR